MDLSNYQPKEPFDQYDPDNEYPSMMKFICDVEAIQAKVLPEWLLSKLPHIKSVIDLGAGPGIYLLPFKEAGCEVLAVDACETGGSVLEPHEFERFDLRFPYTPKRKYDLCWNTETCEHVPFHYHNRMVDTICECADLVLFSAAVPGQGGTYHFSEAPHEYWINKFKERHNYVIHPLQSEMRAFLQTFDKERQEGSFSGWIIENSFLFIKE